MAIAMTVGATKIKVLQENVLASLAGKNPEETKQEARKSQGRKVALPEAPLDAPEEHKIRAK